IAFSSCLSELALEVPADLFPCRVKHRENTLRDDCAPVLRHEDQVDLKRKNYVATAAKVAGTGHRPSYDPCRDPAQGVPLPRLPDAHARGALARMGKRPALAVEHRQRATTHGPGALAGRASLPDRLRSDQRTDRAACQTALARGRAAQRLRPTARRTRQGLATLLQATRQVSALETQRARLPRPYRAAPEDMAPRR